jgi:hypothetical protein
VSGQLQASAPLLPERGVGTHYVRGRVVPRGGVDVMNENYDDTNDNNNNKVQL